MIGADHDLPFEQTTWSGHGITFFIEKPAVTPDDTLNGSMTDFVKQTDLMVGKAPWMHLKVGREQVRNTGYQSSAIKVIR